MADTKTTALSALTGASSATGDVFPIVDISDTTQGASGTTKKMTRAELVAAAKVEDARIGAFLSGDESKLDAIEASADVTDATNVAAAGAVMDGDFSSNGIMYRTGAGTYTNRAENIIKSITVEDPTSSEDIAMFFTPVAITVSQINAVVVGSTPSVTINPTHGTSRAAVTNAILASATAITNTTTGQELTSFGDATIPADSWVALKTTAQSGTVDELCTTITYSQD